jgi:spermidine synthase
MRKLSFGVLFIALATLVLELMLTRVFDIVLSPNLAYFVVTAAVFAFGMAGIYATLRPLPAERDVHGFLAARCVGFALFTAFLVPLINWLPLDYNAVGRAPVKTLAAFAVLYVALVVPFYLAGSALIAAFSAYSAQIQKLYCWDLVGAGLGSMLVVPFIAPIGPGGLMLCASGLALIAAALFSTTANGARVALLLAAAAIAAPFVRMPTYFDFTHHVDKRGLKEALEQGRGEFVRWDPISKINIIDETWTPAISVPWHLSGDRKAIQYDGGNQTSYFYKFDGDLQKLRGLMDTDRSHLTDHFWNIGVLASHYLKRDSNQNVLVIGSAGGQETKAALIYGAAHVDSVELVPTVVELGTGRYASYIGNIFKNPRVHVEAGEGRSFVRHSGKLYDIIEIFSNHTSSSIAQGTGAVSPVYLQTAEAYEEYFTHLTANGVLHINHHVYPRMITTAALAWKRLGRGDFAKHVVVWNSPSDKSLPTMLIKMQPWTDAELKDVDAFLTTKDNPPDQQLTMAENPLDPSRNFLSPVFYSGDFPDSLAKSMPVYVTPRTDDLPFFGNIRKSLKVLKEDPANFLDEGTAFIENIMMTKGVPMDWAHLVSTGVASLVFILLFVLVPLRWSPVGREEGSTAWPLLVYFSCLGAGFITLELVFIQKFMHVVGSPLYTYSTVIFTMLFAAGLGSTTSEKLGIRPDRLWALPFIGVLFFGGALVVLYPAIAKIALAMDLWARVAVSAAMIFPLGFMLGMPFPLGVLAIANHTRGAVAWAWGMNGLFTVAGGLASVVLSMAYGFNVAVICALGLYLVAMLVFPRLRVVPSAH